MNKDRLSRPRRTRIGQIDLCVYRRVPKDVDAAVKRFLWRVAIHLPLVPVDMSLFGVDYIAYGRGRKKQAHGYFMCDGRLRVPQIVVVGRGGGFESRREGVRNVVYTVAHELVHFEQWHKSGKLTERGVNVRAKSLMRLAGIRA